jgi:hypothetical protein
MAMFRLVKMLDTGDPAYFLLCDHPQCMEARRGAAVITNSEEHRLTKKQFLQAAISEGWWVDLEGAFCPAHAREMLHAAREAEEKGKQAVMPARAQDVMAFGRGR